MAITVRIENERADPLDDGWLNVLSTEALKSPDLSSVCLRFVDLYGNTVFNQSQISVLISELERHREQSSSKVLTDVGDSLIGYLHTAQDRLHVYVRFIGE